MRNKWVLEVAGVKILCITQIHTMRLLNHVLCEATHFVFQLVKATISNSLQTSFNRVMQDWPDMVARLATYGVPPQGHL